MSEAPTRALKRAWPLLLLAALAFVIGRATAPEPAAAPGSAEATTAADAAGSEQTIWTCSMHPQIRRNQPGKCPICGMDLIPLSQAQDDDAEHRVTLSEHARALAQVRTTEVIEARSSDTLHLLGHVDYDETRRRTVTAWTDGRIDRLRVRVTGTKISHNQVIATLYSPELYSAFGDLLAARAQAKQLEGAMHGSDALAQSALSAARERLRLLGIPAEEIAEVEARGEAPHQIPIRSPFAGTVLDRLVEEGQYVKAGTPLFHLADLSRVWVQVDAYESDLPSLRVGQPARIEVESLPGQTFEGKIAFIDPVVDPAKRTARVRVEVQNRDGQLKPGMFAKAKIEAVVDGSAREEVEAPLVIPETAPLFTGRRSVVYVELEGGTRPTYELRVVELGPRMGPVYPVLSGLSAGERVVTHGAFAIDAELQLRGGHSMMTAAAPAEEDPQAGDGEDAEQPEHAGHTKDQARATAARDDHAGHGERAKAAPSGPTPAALRAILEAYLALQSALTSDDGATAQRAAQQLARAAAGTDAALASHARKAAAGDLDAARQPLHQIGTAVLSLVRTHGNPLPTTLREARCPMARDGRGGSWLQPEGALRNPYYGAAMLTCGAFQGEAIAPSGAPKRKAAKQTQTRTKAKPAPADPPAAKAPSHDPHAGHQ